ncbi:hypothetical protein [Patulibacter sp. SYSU D01012]|uniref:hypothetical protein n=1 Tax=Patulibacter sp. SYSU D01012 TaxID=2817381 RepID=UPI001B304892|nr:hypothetical protein [Patulibacter sp. SYSU D01012]
MGTPAEIPVLRWSDREARRDEQLAVIARLDEARGGEYVRTRPRNAAEARLLRDKGVPERLIGPDVR